MSFDFNWTETNATLTTFTLPRPDISTQNNIHQSDMVLLVVISVLAVNATISLFLNIFLVFIILYSPSLRTPPNSHLLNICANNIMLCLAMVVCVLSIHFNRMALTDGHSKFIGGVQMFLTYNSLLQYWGTFASIGYYRHMTIKKPGLTLRSRRQLVSRSVAFNWILSSLLSLTVTLSYTPSSRYALFTLDPFRWDFDGSMKHNSATKEHVAVTLIILLAFSVGLGIILTAYYSICRTLNVVSIVGRNRVCPRQQSPHIHSDSNDLTMSVARSYRPQYLVSTPSFIGEVLSKEHKDAFIVMYNKQDSTVVIDDLVSDSMTQRTTSSRNENGEKINLSSTLSNSSNNSVKSKTPEFTDISRGEDLLRFQKEQSQTLQSRHSFRRETISLKSAIKNSLAMLIAYCICSFPLIVFSVPDSGWGLTGAQRVTALLACRALFYMNALAFPLWYLLFSATVRKCFTRLKEGILGRYKCH
ncbi:hypothetical protein Bpfe_001669 [Biomphalaria pfeifferi]|uniref:G-protein coupled receptors family 1 profile domain-containing protein n=1 Tax=Biomphalaria pfeifferi TaxID=112525 RepID=A0AAD8FMA2_BIOPF|nr:hypothetical protein Bpfe_001669 [Biomphalaria pfeifferi]